MKLRLISTAVLTNGTDMLMMKRPLARTLSPGLWAGIGGHLEPYEIGEPEAACLREIREETGFAPEEITDLTLQYILIRLKEREIRQQFIYFGRTAHRQYGVCTEGELHWIPLDQVLNRELPYVYRSLLRHYYEFGPSPHIWVATASCEDVEDETCRPTLHWAPLKDPLIP